jgi:alanine racemase
MSGYLLRELQAFTNARLIGNDELRISRLLIDSRHLFSSEETLFIALSGQHHDGHTYIKQLYKNGIRAFVVQEQFDTKAFAEASFLLVENPLRALQAITGKHRTHMACPVLGITGSNGKTIIKEWITHILSPDKLIVRSPRSYNSQVGVPLSLWLLHDQVELGIIEAGISMPNEMKWLQKIIQPNQVLITNIGQAHQENFTSQSEKLIEKLQLAQSAETIFFCRDHSSILQHLDTLNLLPKSLSWGTQKEADLHVLRKEATDSGLQIEYTWQHVQYTINIPFQDEASFENAMHALLAAHFHQTPQASIAKRIASIAKVNMRLEVKEGINNCLLIDDTYSLDLNSLEIALEFLNQQGRKKGLSKTLILSDVLQSGLPPTELYQRVTNLVREKEVDRLIGIGQTISTYFRSANLKTELYPSTLEFLQQGSFSSFKNEAILLKGARSFSFERIGYLLEQKIHKTVLEINLNALTNNLHAYRQKLKQNTRMMVMVKAFSYGSGSFEIANLLQHQKVDYLGVAFADEGVELRLAGISLPIMVMNPDSRSFPLLLQYGLEPEIYSFSQLEAFIKTVEEEGLAHMPVHVKLDTGMSRLGFLPKQLPQLIDQLKNQNRIYVKSAFSHLAGSEDHVHDAFTKHQIKLFSELSLQLKSGIGYPFLRHILNSAGIERFPEAQFDMVRMGIGLYGVSASGELPLKNVVSLKTYITQIKEIPAFESIGYGREGVLKHDARIAIVPVGYADGLDRRMGNEHGKLMINGRFAPIIGNVCMDMCMVDVTNIKAQEGDQVVVFGEEYPVANVAQACGTIPYEILTGINRRVKRIYFSE